MSGFEAKRQARIDRHESRAEKARRLASQIEASAHKRASAIPFGQPILIGHHSERGDRNYRGRITRDFERTMRLRAYADACDRKAIAAESHRAIFSDDPAASEKLRAKLAEREQQQGHMKKLNTAWRKAGKQGLLDCGLTDAQTAHVVQGIERAYSWEKQPYPSYALTNNNAEIRRLKQRLIEADTKALQSDRVDESETREGVTLVRAYSDNRLRLRFPGRPAPALIQALKSNGFRWCPSEGVWQRHLNAEADYAAGLILEKMQAMNVHELVVAGSDRRK